MILDKDFVCAWCYIRQMLRKQRFEISKYPKPCFAYTDLVQKVYVIVSRFFQLCAHTLCECTCLVAVYLVFCFIA